MVTDFRSSVPAGAILVGVDTSDCSRLALEWAVAVARQLDVPLRAVQAWQYPTDTVWWPRHEKLADAEHTEAMLSEQLTALLDEVVADTDGLDAGIEVVRGPTSGALLHLAGRHASMIVVGSRGLGGFRGLLLGSVSRQLCEHAACPVTVVRHLPEDRDIHLGTIVVGVDGSAHAARALAQAGDLAERTGAQIIAVHATHGTQTDASVQPLATRRRSLPDLLEDWCTPLHVRGLDDHESVIVEGDARTALVEVADERGADLLVIGSRGLGPVTKLVLGSVASSLIHHSHIPVTVVPRMPER